MVEPLDHDKVDTLVYICSEHSGEQVIAEVDEDSDAPSIELRSNKLCDTDSEDTNDEVEDSCGEAVEEEEEKESEEGTEDDEGSVMQSQSLLGNKNR